MKSWLATWGHILRDAARLLGAHWPQLVVLCLLGVAGRYGFVWLAVAGSDVHPTLGLLILPLAPLSNLLSLVLMMRVVAESLPAFRVTWQGETPSQQWRHHLRVATGVLLPFIAVYASVGMLRQDSRMYIQGITLEEYGRSIMADTTRYEYASGWVLAALVIGALTLRKVIEITQAAKRSGSVALAATYVEVLWLMTLAAVLSSQIEQIMAWFADRAVVDGVLTTWDALLAPVETWWRAATAWLATMSGGFGAFVVLPLTWLAITATAYQTSFEVRAELPKAVKLVPRAGSLGWAQRLLLEALDPVVSPIKKLVTTFLRVVAAGAGPLLMLCVTVMVLGQAQVGLGWLLRLAVGPRPFTLDPMIAPYLNAVTHVFFFVILMSLLPATLNYLASGQRPVRGSAVSQETVTGNTR